MATQDVLAGVTLPDAETDAAEPPPTAGTGLPPRWRLVRLGEVFAFTKKPRELRYADVAAIPFVPMESVPIGELYFDQYALKSPAELTSGTYFEAGDVLVAKITPSFENGKQGIIEHLPVPFGVATTEVIPIKAIPGTSEREFLFYYLLWPTVRTALAAKMDGTTGRQRLSATTLANWEMLLPPPPEQRAIARALRSVQAAIQARRREVALERERKAALMHHLFTHGMGGLDTATKATRFGRVPAPWVVMLLDNCAHVQTGVAKGRQLGNAATVRLPYLRVANVQDGYLDLADIKYIALRQSEVGQYTLQAGDVVVTEGGDFDKLGRGFLWRGEVPDCVHQNHIFAVRADRTLLRPDYLAYLIQSGYGKAYFLSVAHRTTNLASINSTKLKAFPALLPSLEEQRDIAATLDACDGCIDALEHEAAFLDELFRALLDALMTGRLSALPLVDAEMEAVTTTASEGAVSA